MQKTEQIERITLARHLYLLYLIQDWVVDRTGIIEVELLERPGGEKAAEAAAAEGSAAATVPIVRIRIT